MIGRLRGLVAEIGEEETLIDVSGVGYVVRCGSRTLGRLPVLGEETVLQIEVAVVRGGRPAPLRLPEPRGAPRLRRPAEIEGVGPKAALGVLDVLTPGELAGAAQRGDKAIVARASGVGPKLAAAHGRRAQDKAPASTAPYFAGAEGRRTRPRFT